MGYLKLYCRWMVVIMALRDDILAQFGPKLIEAMLIDLFENIKELRRATGQPERTLEDFLTEVSARIPNIPDYDWMTNI